LSSLAASWWTCSIILFRVAHTSQHGAAVGVPGTSQNDPLQHCLAAQRYLRGVEPVLDADATSAAAPECNRVSLPSFSLPTRAIQWDDVEHVAAIAARKDTSVVTHTTILTLWFTFKPDRLPAASAARARQPLHLDIDLGNLSLPADELVALMRHYHAIHWLRPPRNAQAEWKTRRRNHQAFHEW
jgi:hypothetical protein